MKDEDKKMRPFRLRPDEPRLPHCQLREARGEIEKKDAAFRALTVG